MADIETWSMEARPVRPMTPCSEPGNGYPETKLASNGRPVLHDGPPHFSNGSFNLPLFSINELASLQARRLPRPYKSPNKSSSGGRNRSARSRVNKQSTPFAMAGCCDFLRWPSTSHSRLGYRSLDADEEAATATVVVGKERRVFAVDQLVLDSYPFRVLLETVPRKDEQRGRAIFVDVDAILFEHILWLACDGRSLSQLLQLDLKEIIEFYAQDA